MDWRRLAMRHFCICTNILTRIPLWASGERASFIRAMCTLQRNLGAKITGSGGVMAMCVFEYPAHIALAPWVPRLTSSRAGQAFESLILLTSSHRADFTEWSTEDGSRDQRRSKTIRPSATGTSGERICQSENGGAIPMHAAKPGR
jgi:hypothetical protein